MERDCWASNGEKRPILENEYVEYFKAREKRAEERGRSMEKAEIAARVDKAILIMRECGMTDDEIKKIKEILMPPSSSAWTGI